MSRQRIRKYCAVNGCPNTSRTKPDLSYFTFPRDADKRSKWLDLIGREDLLDKTGGHYVVCEEHFNVHDIKPGSSRNKLKITAFPYFNLPSTTKIDIETQIEVLTCSRYIQTEKVTEDVPDDISQASRSLCSDMSRKRKLKLELSQIRKKIKIDEVDNKNDKHQEDTLHKLCDKLLTKELAELVKAQTFLKFNDTENMYDDDYIMFCLRLYYTRPQAYQSLRNALCLPCPSALSKYHIPITTETDERIMLALKTRIESMTEQEKICSVQLDKIRLKASLFYDIRKDKIFGFNEIDGIQTAELARNALVVLVRGIFNDWTQPIAFALLSECRNNGEIIKWTDKLLEKLLRIGLDIRTFVSGVESDLFKTEKSVTIEKPYFFINHKKIYYIFDVSHLIKSVRDNLMLYNFHFHNWVIKYEHILQFYNQDKRKDFRLAPKLTDRHVNPTTLIHTNFEKTKTCYATQLLSNSVASGISTYVDFNAIDETGRDTANFIKIMNNLYDTLNAKNVLDDDEYKRAFCGEETQVKFFTETLELFRNLKVIIRTDSSDLTSNIKFIQGFQITIRSILLLFEDLKLEGFIFLITRRISLDTLETLFGQIGAKTGRSTAPTTKQFMSAFRKLFFSNIIKPLKAEKCSDVLGKALIDSNSLEQNRISNLDREAKDIQVASSDYNQLDFAKKNFLVYICRHLLKKCSEVHSDCQILKTYINPPLDLKSNTEYLRYKAYRIDTGSKFEIVPRDDFMEFYENMEERLQSTFENNINRNILSSIFKEMDDITLSPLPCPCFPIRYLKKLFIRMRIFCIIKSNNKRFLASDMYGPLTFSISNK